jgi:prepilin-type N-terminal cleavage/methylation domain-containing protein
MLKTSISALFKKDKGFTLVELMIVTLIIALITAIVLINYRAGNRQLALNRSANKLAQDIRRAQEMAMSAAQCPTGTGCAGQLPPRYGIFSAQSNSNPTSYILFADISEDGVWHPGGPLPRDEIIETLPYEEGVYLSDICCDIYCSGWPVPGHRRLSVTFKPPDPITEIRVGGPPGPPLSFNCSKIILTLGVQGSSQTRTVEINNAGLIYAD